MGALTNRRKGHNLERRIVNLCKDIGFKKCRTSRQASRILDDSKVDIAMIPYNIQCKKGYRKGLNYTKVFEEMVKALENNFLKNDPQITYPKIIVHDRGRKKTDKHVVMMEHEFFELIRKIKILEDKND